MVSTVQCVGVPVTMNSTVPHIEDTILIERLGAEPQCMVKDPVFKTSRGIGYGWLVSDSKSTDAGRSALKSGK